METVITPYKYFYFGKEQVVYVEKGHEHPDPSGLLTWGRDITGEVVPGNYNRYFSKAGKPIKVPYTVQGCLTASEESERRIEAVKRAIRALN